MKKDSFHLETWALDDKARVIVCDKCGQRGDVMSIEWNFDNKAKAWEPQERHIPKCGHVAVPLPHAKATRTYHLRDEHSPCNGRQRLTLWSGGFCSDFEGDAIELPSHTGFSVSVGGKSLIVKCPSPRTEANYLDVDAAINSAIAKATGHA